MVDLQERPVQRVGLVIISHSLALAEAAREFAQKMIALNSGLRIHIAAGDEENGFGTSFKRVEQAIVEAAAEEHIEAVLVIADIGSARMLAETVQEVLSDRRIHILDLPFLEGLFAVTGQLCAGASVDEILQTVQEWNVDLPGRKTLGEHTVDAAENGQEETVTSAVSSLQNEKRGADAAAGNGAVIKTGQIPQIRPKDFTKTVKKILGLRKERNLAAPAKLAADRTRAVRVPNAQGIHARPAMLIAQTAARYDAHVSIASDSGETVSARSPLAVTGLNSKQNDTVWVFATGLEASEAVQAIVQLIQSGFGEENRLPNTVEELKMRVQEDYGIGLSAGRVVGRVLRTLADLEAPVQNEPLEDALRNDEVKRLLIAAERVAALLEMRANATADSTRREILQAVTALLRDPVLHDDTTSRVLLLGDTAECAVWNVLSAVMIRYEQSGGALAERVADIRDLRARWVSEIRGKQVSTMPIATLPHILVAEDLSPIEATELNQRLCLGLILGRGGPTSHAVIIAKSLGIPVVVHPLAVHCLRNGVRVCLDGASGQILIEPEKEDELNARSRPILVQEEARASARVLLPIEHYDGAVAERVKKRGLSQCSISSPAVAETDAATAQFASAAASAVPLTLSANLNFVAEARAARALGVQNIGLYRTEYFYLDRSEPPTFAEQTEAYTQVLREFSGGRVIFRVIDFGADKVANLNYITKTREVNPALGVRGIRLAQQHESLFRAQLSAIAAAAAQVPETAAWVMAPMVSTLAETEWFISQVRSIASLPVGVTVETPSSVLLMPELARILDFVSIGTNDLTQYALAADRVMTALSAFHTPWQPAVLRLIAQALNEAGPNLHVSVCGEAASDPLLALLLAGLGVNDLSMNPKFIPFVSQKLQTVTFDTCVRLAQEVCAMPTAEEALKRAESFVEVFQHRARG